MLCRGFVLVGLGLVVFSSFVLCMRYRTNIWEKVPISLWILELGILSSLMLWMVVLCIPPLKHDVLITRGLTLHPCVVGRD